MNGNLLSRPKAGGTLDGPEPSGAALDYRRQVESDILAKINSTLGPILGSEKFRAGVSVECDFAGGELSEEVYDPAHSVMLSQQRTEDNTGTAAASGVPGTASTLPRPTSRPANGSGKTSRVTENITYQSSRTVKKTRMPAGAVRKMSVAVLVDQEVTWQKDQTGYKRVLVPPPPEKLKVIRDLLAGITGFSPERGDQLVIDTLPFETTLLLEPPGGARPQGQSTPAPVAGLPLKLDQKTLMISGGALAVVIVALIAILIMRRRKGGSRVAEASAPAELPAGRHEHPSASTVDGTVEKQIETQLAEREALQLKADAQALGALKLAPVITKKAEVFAKHLREKISKEPEISVQILKSWIREDES
jgi:flagellar M-ring protein FliF